MADFDNRVTTGQATVTDVIDAGLRAYMIRIYNYMFIGLMITGAVAYGTYMLATTTDPALAAAQMKNGVLLTSFGLTLYGSPLQWVVIFSPLILVFLLQARIPKMSVGAAQLAFWAFAGVMGVSLSSIFIMYLASSIAQVFFITAAMFGAMSLWGYTTKSDLTGFGSFLIMGLWGVVIASVVNVFLQSQMLSFVYSIVGVIVFTGITAYHTQQLKVMYSANDDGTVTGRKAVFGALSLYITFINLFLSLLRLMGNRR
ncbi:MAG: Bax inhibitor-1/YccA family protein [Proteobacteria bacterium]|nr:Bax inhibitor-1/YccA family protein [Pseudomonadota bacterium]